MKAVFFGTSNISREILEALIDGGFEISAVVTTPDRNAGRGMEARENPIANIAEVKGIRVFKSDKPGEFVRELEDIAPDFIVVADYGKILPKELLEIPSKGPVNVHYSLLPKYRGASPVKSALLNGDEKTGVTIMLMDEKLDEGPILAQEEVAIFGNDDHTSLMDKLNGAGKKLLIKTLKDYGEGKIKPVPQDSGEATYAKKITKEDGRIDWQKSAKHIERMVRAFKNWPSAWTMLNGKTVKIIEVEPVNNDIVQPAPGRICNVGGELHVECGDSTSLLIHKLQIEGKKEISGSDFLNTIRDKEARFS